MSLPNPYIEQIKQEVLPTLPHEPGIYKYFDENDTIIYVGKAKDLRKRVASYFTKQLHDSAKTYLLVKNIRRIEFAVVETEQDALLLENVLIKQWQPKYNIQLKDDKTYPYICIKKEDFPRVLLTRQLERDGSEYYGPYAQTGTAYIILELIQHLFKLRTCTLSLTPANIAASKFKVCLEYHVGNCAGPCAALQSEAVYSEMIAQIRHILKGNISSVIQYLKELMRTYADAFEFEKAQAVKEKLTRLQNYQSKSTVVNPKINNVDVFYLENTEKRAFVSFLKVVNGAIIQTKVIEIVKRLDETPEELLLFGLTEMRTQFNSNAAELILPFAIDYPSEKVKIVVPQIGDKKKLLELARKNAFYFRKQYEIKTTERRTGQERRFEVLNRLKKDLRLTELPEHIECFDNSNIQGAFPVAAMVVFKNGQAAKKDYRHFNIKTVEGPDDFASMEEIVFRRYKRLMDEQQPLPQLILIDGGKGQLGAAIKSLEKLGIYGKMAIAGIAKKLEEIYLPNDPLPLHLDKRSESLHLIQQIRNEAHRFAITFHRQKRSKGTIKSELDDIKGLGPKSVEKLLTTFKSIDQIRQADVTALKQVLNEKQAQAVLDYFTKSK